MIKMKLNVLMAEHEITQKDLSKVTGIRQGTISAYCGNYYKHIVKEHLDILCDYFNCEIQDLIQYRKIHK